MMSLTTRFLEALATGNGNFCDRDEQRKLADAYWSAPSGPERDALFASISDAPYRHVRTNERDNIIVDTHLGDGDRYQWDFDDDFRADGWRQFDTDQDAPYFGVWVNPSKRWMLTYAEGDLSLVVCATAEHYNAELRSMCEFYGKQWAVSAYDDKTGEWVRFYEDRNQFFLPA